MKTANKSTNVVMIGENTRNGLFSSKELTEEQKNNSDLNFQEISDRKAVINSKPRRLVFELTNKCNLNCVMCGRNAAKFQLSEFKMEWFRYFEPMFNTIEEVTLMGWGEPTMHPNFKEMLEILSKHSARKYFCTNGMLLDELHDAIFECEVEGFAVSLDGAAAETNDRIRRGADFNKIIENVRKIVNTKKNRGLNFPFINFVFCAMQSNIHELPELVRVAAEIGVDEVKVVYLTSFEHSIDDEVLWDDQEKVEEIFNEAIDLGKKLGVIIKLPYIQGKDIAGEKMHKDCFVPWRDFFLGSDGYIRPCMSTSVKFEEFSTGKKFTDMWNSEHYQKYRQSVNDEDNMDDRCKLCYQSSHCNWNKKSTWFQGEGFAPKWQPLKP